VVQRAGAFPTEFIDRLGQVLEGRELDQALASFAAPRATAFRANTLKIAPHDVLAALQREGLRAKVAPGPPHAFELTGGSDADLRRSSLYCRGAICVQGLASMLPPLVLAPKPGERVLDLTAAPGSKTTQMAAMMEDRGSIVACDSDPIRVQKLRALVELQGCCCVEVRASRGETLALEEPASFDRVLLDAPCSGEGRFRTKEPSTWKHWKPSLPRQMARRQKRLLYSGLLSLRQGGVLVYSTCTFAPEENEGVLAWALRRFAGSIELLKFECPWASTAPGLVAWSGSEAAPELARARRVLPSASMEGFFMARLRRTSADPPQPAFGSDSWS
jgi:16S rRNA (cytosine1407-C5)-methyltransferase